VAPAGSFNNEIGLPLTALRCDPQTRFLIAEMGAREPGNIQYLCGITPPEVAVVLNVGAAHVGVFGSREVTARTKAELVAALPAGGVAVLNADDPVVAAMPVPPAAQTLLFGRMATSAAVRAVDVRAVDVRAVDVRLDDAARAGFRLVTPDGEAPVRLRLHGEHHVSNALAAAAVGHWAGLPVSRIAELLSQATPASRWRMEVTTRTDGVTVINDAYNANPDSVRAALDALAATRGSTRWAVLGEMLELGDSGPAEHATVGREAARRGIGQLVAIGGPVTRLIADAASENGSGTEAVWVPDAEAALATLRARVRPGDVVLVKGSRAVGLDELARQLLDDHGDDQGGDVPGSPDGAGGVRGGDLSAIDGAPLTSRQPGGVHDVAGTGAVRPPEPSIPDDRRDRPGAAEQAGEGTA
jgi:UDP-N-acetylmuramoyl-tripeptide--D-alanyl-D-alanine ligase